jgi:PAS domain S-box-containing protein
MSKILVIDDEKPIRELIGAILEASDYDCTLAGSASEARDILKEGNFELILCDINMPKESGLEFIQYALAEYPDTAAVMVSAMDDPVTAEVALDSGVYDYIIKPFERSGVIISVANALRRRQLEIDNRAYRESLEKKVEERTAALQESEARLRAIFEAAEHVAFIMIDHSEEEDLIVEFSGGAERMLGYKREKIMGQPPSVLRLPKDVFGFQEVANSSDETKKGFTQELTLTRKSGQELPVLFTRYPIFNSHGNITATLIVSIDISERKKAEREIKDSMQRWRRALDGSIYAMALTVETRDRYTAGHQQRVADLAAAIATELGLSEDRIDGLRMGGLIHDIGKISIPAEILSKPGRINEIEFELIKMHSKVGYDILKNIEFPWPIAQMELEHHERMDGSGYPSGLSGEEILLEARILGVADVVEAMSSHRPYRAALGVDKALEEISDNRGILYDPDVVDACLNVFRKRGFKFG